MGLFEILKLSSDCYLCGCPVAPVEDNLINPLANAPIICDGCHLLLPQSNNTCISCGLPLAKTGSQYSTDNPQSIQTSKQTIPCGACLKQSPVYDRTVSGFHYEPPINDFITQLKYSAQFQLLPLLCEYLIKKVKEGYIDEKLPNSLLPVPLHPKKRVQRGFNQSQLIAHRVAQALNLKVISKGVRRIKQTKAQSGLDSAERKSNIKGAFQVVTKLPAHIAIIDDVVTTGMTVSELAKQARLHGAKRIDVWCLARAYEL